MLTAWPPLDTLSSCGVARKALSKTSRGAGHNPPSVVHAHSADIASVSSALFRRVSVVTKWSGPHLVCSYGCMVGLTCSVHVIPGGILDWQRWGLAEFVFVAPDPYYSMCCVCSIDVSKCCLQGLDCVLC